MLSRRERLLLNVLAWVLIAAAAGVGFSLQLERRSDALRGIGRVSGQLEELDRRTADPQSLAHRKLELTRALVREESRRYAAGEMDPYRFGILIRDLLLQEGLEIRRYQTQEAKGGNLLEFAVSGSALGLARFLEKVSESPKLWTVPFLSISAGEGGKAQAVLRIGYESIDEAALSGREAPAPAPHPPAAEESAPPGEIAALFGWVENPPRARSLSLPEPAPWLKPVGFVFGEGGVPSYIFKDTRSGSVLTLVPKVESRGWILREVRDADFLLSNQGAQYVVKREQ